MKFSVKKLQNEVYHFEYQSSEFGNSFSIQSALELEKLLENDLSKAQAIVFSSAGRRFFCTGGNLAHYAKQTEKSEGLEENARIKAILDHFHGLPMFKLAVVDGDTFGGGMEMLSCFDYSLATPQSYFGFWQRRLSLSTGWGGGQRWADKLGPEKVRSLVSSAKSFGAHQALRWSLIDEVVPRSLISERLNELIVHHQKWPLEPLGYMSEYPANEAHAFSQLWFSESHLKKLKR